MSLLDDVTYDQLDGAADERQIEAVERALAVRFPPELRRVLPRCHSGTPHPQLVVDVDYPGVGVTRTTVGQFLSLASGSWDFVLAARDRLRREGLVPEGVVPFALDGGGDLFALDYRGEASEPAVVYVALEAAQEGDEHAHMVPLASSFAAFVRGLVPLS